MDLIEARNLAIAILVVAAPWLPEIWRWWQSRRFWSDNSDRPYAIYTTQFDVEIRARDIPSRLKDISADYPRYWVAEGNPDFIAEVVAAKALVETFGATPKHMSSEATDIAVTLLIDHSGSMRGEPIRQTAAAARLIMDSLTSTGYKCELLGFTTAGWKGGFPRAKWLKWRYPRNPGRLCATMHIVYKSFEDDALADSDWRVMLNPGIVYENIDGEAIEWAEQRLLARPEKQRLLVVISDGAPVDDSTLLENRPTILERHLIATINRIEAEGRIALMAIGIGHDVGKYYPQSIGIEELADIPSAALAFVSKSLG